MIDGADGHCHVLRDEKHKARKQHRCSECSRMIRVGEIYQAEATLFDGSFDHHKTCMHCQVARRWLSANCGGWVYGGVEEDIIEHVHDYRRKDLIRLKYGMARLWTKRNGELMAIPAMPADLGGKDAARLMQ
jgi:hypothetical protein